MWHVRTLSPISMRDVSWMLRPPSHLVLLPACLLSPGYCCLVPGAWCLVLSGPRLPLLPATSLRCAYYRPGWPNDAASQPPSYRTSMDVKPTRQGMHHASHRQGDASRAHAVSLHDIISPSSEAEKPNALRQMPPHDARTLPESLAGGPSRSPVAPLSYGAATWPLGVQKSVVRLLTVTPCTNIATHPALAQRKVVDMEEVRARGSR